VNPEGFLRDVLVAPARLEALLDAYEGPRSPLAELAGEGGFRRVVFMGMGSSRFAAVSIAALMRSRGVDAVAELASTGSPTRPSADTLAVGISASGGTAAIPAGPGQGTPDGVGVCLSRCVAPRASHRTVCIATT